MSFESDRASMDRFPPPIARGMRQSGAMTTCLPVQIDTGQWETAVFFEVGGNRWH